MPLAERAARRPAGAAGAAAAEAGFGRMKDEHLGFLKDDPEVHPGGHAQFTLIKPRGTL
jgi:hypothetical protein